MGLKNYRNRFPVMQCGTGGLNPGSIQGAAQRFAMFGALRTFAFCRADCTLPTVRSYKGC